VSCLDSLMQVYSAEGMTDDERTNCTRAAEIQT
jgi:hypothetical protein